MYNDCPSVYPLKLVEYPYGKYGEHVVALKLNNGMNYQIFDACAIFTKNNSRAEYERVKDEAALFAKTFVDKFNSGNNE